MSRFLMYGGVLAGVIVMFLPVHASLLGLPISCGTGWEAATATGDTGTVCNGAGDTRGLIAASVVVVCVVLGLIAVRAGDNQDRDEALLAVLTPDQRAQYEATIGIQGEAQSRFGIVGRLAVGFAVVVLVLVVVVYA